MKRIDEIAIKRDFSASAPQDAVTDRPAALDKVHYIS
jgi:hypothetical protein